LLSTGTSGTVVVKAGGVTVVSVALEGIVHDVILTLANTDPLVGTPATIALSAVVEDADQNLIVGAAHFSSPISLTTTDPTAGPLSRTLLQSPADLSGIAVRYSGANVADRPPPPASRPSTSPMRFSRRAPRGTSTWWIGMDSIPAAWSFSTCVTYRPRRTR